MSRPSLSLVYLTSLNNLFLLSFVSHLTSPCDTGF